MNPEPNTADPYDDEPTASELREAFQERIGATPDRDKALWSALDRVIVSYANEQDRSLDEAVERLAQHFPSLTRAMIIAWHHVKLEDVAIPCGVCMPDA